MKEEENKKRKHGTVQRLFAALGVFAIFITSILTLIFGLSGVFVAIYVAALASITGPAFTEGADGFLEIVTGIMELVVEGIAMIFDFIGSLFSGF
jgi:uncharacterized membrane protein